MSGNPDKPRPPTPTSPKAEPAPSSFTDHKLVLSFDSDLHHIMRLKSTKTIDPTALDAPVTLERKQMTPCTRPTIVPETAMIDPRGGGVRNKQKLFNKKTKQLHLENEEQSQRNEIESEPWVLEDYNGQKSWTGELEDGQQASYYVFVPSDDGFKAIKADNWYKFNPNIQRASLTAEEAGGVQSEEKKEEEDEEEENK
ncbi:hypothetical protein BGZ67_005374 [Mortierella alpina]|nr:hypothetical protein BGZ67_005374 [Mortierella alpina]